MVVQTSPQVSEGLVQRAELLDVLSEVKTRVQDKMGSVDFPLPQFILIGKQSVCQSVAFLDPTLHLRLVKVGLSKHWRVNSSISYPVPSDRGDLQY